MKTLLVVAAGGAIGSVARYALSQVVRNTVVHHLPLGTLAVNLLGSLLIGIVIGLLERTEGYAGSSAALFLTIGCLGGFTTFSTFSWEAIAMIRDEAFVHAAIYLVSTLLGGLLLTAGGFFLASNFK